MVSQQPDPMPRLQAKLAGSLSVARYLTVQLLQPNLSPEKRALLENLQRSARAEIQLRNKAIQYQESQQPTLSAMPPGQPPPQQAAPQPYPEGMPQPHPEGMPQPSPAPMTPSGLPPQT